MNRKCMAAVLAALLAAGCSSTGADTGKDEPQEETQETAVSVEGLKILTPLQAPALSLLPVLKDGKNTVDFAINGAEDLKPAFLNPSPEYDVIIAPTNLGVQLAANGKTGYRMLAVVDWGNLYIVGTEDADLEGDGSDVAYFGQDSVPGLVFAKAYPNLAEKAKVFASASDAQADLMAGHVKAALLAEPLATATVAKSEGKLKIISDVQEAWGGTGFPMAAMFVNGETYEQNKDMYAAMIAQMKDYAANVDMNDPSALIEDINAVGVETLGLPSAEIVAKCYDRMNVEITDVSGCVDAVADFLAVWNVNDISAALAK